MFRGNHPAKVDEKGRLKLPSAFKQLVDAGSVTQFYVTSTDGESAQVWPLPEWEKREAQLAESSEMEEAVQKYLSITGYYGQQVEMDAQTRLLIPQILRSAAGLDDEEAVLIGMGTYIEVHNRKRFEQNVLGNKLTVQDKARLAEITRRKQ
jgi:transcriptional regulator MraZ